MRRTLSFDCEGMRLAAALDEGARDAALLIVTGGNETRAGAFRGQAALAAAIADAGHPVLRFDRRGVGDSDGENHGFRSSAPDIAAAIAALRREMPHVQRVVGFGNCDAAAALLLHQGVTQCDALVLCNPWVIDAPDVPPDAIAAHDAPPLPPAAAIRARYLRKLVQPAEWRRLLTGQIDFAKLGRGLRAAAPTAAMPVEGLSAEVLDVIAALRVPATLLLAERDRTAMAFEDAWRRRGMALPPAMTRHRFDTASHGLAGDAAFAWLTERMLERLAAP